MTTTKLADTREMTLQDAVAVFADLAQAEIRLAKLTVATEDRIARLKAEYDANSEALRLARDAHARRLEQFIMGHPEQFQNPRAVVTDYGKFGRRNVANVEVADPQAVIDWALETGSLDTIKVTRAPVKPAIGKRLRAGEEVPGCRLVEGEEAFYQVDRQLMDAAAHPLSAPEGEASTPAA